jgi:MoaA/NifB/PqqE/SkfB family radical SAM enzyme
LPYQTRFFHISFYGGEPLLSFPVIRRIVEFLEEQNRSSRKKARYSITTNGSLASSEVIDFLSRHHFAMTLSFDGLAQDGQRGEGSFELVLSRLRDMKGRPGLALGVNSVFTPEAVGCIADSLEMLMRLGLRRLTWTVSVQTPWDQAALVRLEAELIRLRAIALRHYRRTRKMPLDLFSDAEPEGIFACSGGKNWLAIDPRGRVWGCPLMADYFQGREATAEARRYGFGSLSGFRRNPEALHARRMVAYSRLNMDNVSTSRGPCFMCPEVKRCSICPVSAGLAGEPLDRIPDDLCAIQKIKIREQRLFREEAGRISFP